MRPRVIIYSPFDDNASKFEADIIFTLDDVAFILMRHTHTAYD